MENKYLQEALSHVAKLQEELETDRQVIGLQREALLRRGGVMRRLWLSAKERLTAAEQRNAELIGLLQDTKTVLGNELSYELFQKLNEHMRRIDGTLKPTESGANE